MGYYKPCAEFDRCNELIEKYWNSGEFEKCFAGHLELAEATHYPLAECQVGHFYREGIGVKQDDERALYWTRLAAEHGDRGAQYNLAEFYENGLCGLAQDMAAARRLYAMSAAQGDEAARKKCSELKIELPKKREMRRRDREVLDRGEMLGIIAECDCCRLGLSDAGMAYIVPMNFGFESSDNALTLYFHCAPEGRKIDIIGSGAEVSFEMDCGHALSPAERACGHSYAYKCVMGTGHIAPLTDHGEKLRALNLIMEHYSGKSDWDFDENVVSRLTVLKLDVSDWSCKRRQ